jgi:glycosyltransferase involved in cell wall biosynthesis
MLIALYHNLGVGGGKRHLYEHARALRARGHVLDLFAPATANETFLPLAPLCRSVRFYGHAAPSPSSETSGPAPKATLRRIARAVAGAGGTDLLAERYNERRHRSRIGALAASNAEIARDIDAGGYDVAYIHQCALTLAPDLLRFLRRTPSVFVCNDTPRWAYEWALDGPADYDRLSEPAGRRKRLGRLVSPVVERMAADADRTFVANTRAANLVLSNSCFSRECTVRATGANPRVCYPGVDPEFFSPPAGECGREGAVLSVGAMLPNKQHEYILRAVALIPQPRRPRLRIVGYESPLPGDAAGEGPEGRRLTALAAALSVELTLTRDVTDESVRDAYRTAGVVAFAPYLEPFGLVAVEAMACGAPVVGVREGGVRETIRDGETGLLSDRDPVAYAAALDRTLTEPALSQAFGVAARARVLSDWTWERSVDVAEAWLTFAATSGGGI